VLHDKGLAQLQLLREQKGVAGFTAQPPDDLPPYGVAEDVEQRIQLSFF
jgi:hypothetical protein